MNPAEGFGLVALFIGFCGFLARVLNDAKMLDVLALSGFCVALGYLWGAA